MFELPTVPGSQLTREQVLFAWALGEAFSPRWRDTFLPHVGDGTRRKIERGETRNYGKKEQEKMVSILRRRRPFLTGEYIDKSIGYKIIPLPADQLGRIVVLPTFGWKKHPVPLSDYVNEESLDEWKDDPRQIARTFLKNPPSAAFTGYPIVAYNQELQSVVLIDGYARCITALLRQRAGETLPPMLIIYCAPAHAKREPAP